MARWDPWVRDCALYIWAKVRPNRYLMLLIESYLSHEDAMHRELDALDFSDAAFWDMQEQDASADCPLSVLVPLEWEQVMWYMNRKGKMVYDAKNSPVPLPHPQMEFRGYVECDVDASVSAFFVDKRRKGERGTRLPSKPAGGAGGENKRRRA